MPSQNVLDQVQKIYIAYYGRPADPAGLDYWAGVLDAANGRLDSIIDAFANSPESQALFGPMTTIEARVTAIYQHVLNRAPDPDGLQFYVNAVASGGLSLGALAVAVLNGAIGEDAPLIQNKLTVANSFTHQVGLVAQMRLQA